MSAQLSLLAPEVLLGLKSYNTRRAYVTQGQERPADLPRLRESAETMEVRVLAWYQEQRARFERTGASEDVAHTPTQCAAALGLKLTTVRPRICQLAKMTTGPRLERCFWLPRRPTEDGGSEGWHRYTERTQA